MIERESIKDFHAGQRALSAEHLNKIVRAVRRRLVVSPPLKLTETTEGDYLSLIDHGRWWVGKIDASSQPSDYSDCRYFVVRQKIASSDGSQSDLLAWAEETFPRSDTVTVVNLPEESDNTHVLPNGMRVVVFELEDRSTPTLPRYIMSETPPPCFHGVYDPEGSDSPLFPARSDPVASDVSGDPANSDHFWAKGWMFIDSDSRMNPWVALQFQELIVVSDIRV